MSLLDTPILKNQYRISECPNMDPEAEGLVKPYLAGVKASIVPVCVDRTDNEYHVADHPLREVVSVEIGADQLTEGIDYQVDLESALIKLETTPLLASGATYYFTIEGIEIDAANHLQFYAEASTSLDDYMLISGAVPGVWSASGTGRSVCFEMYFRVAIGDADPAFPWVWHEQTVLPTAADLLGSEAARTRIAQKFTAPTLSSTGVYLTAIRLYFRKVGTPRGSVRVRIYSSASDAAKVGTWSNPLLQTWPGGDDGSVYLSSNPAEFYYQTGAAWPIREAGVGQIVVEAEGRYNPGSTGWTQLATTSHDYPIVFGDYIYATSSGTLRKWTGSAWTQVAAQSGTETVHCLCVFSGKLYGGTGNSGKLLEWNGTDAWIEKAPTFGTSTTIRSLCVHNSKLYGGTNDGKLLEWNGVDAWAEKADQYGSETDIYSLVTFDSKLYGGTYPTGKLLEWNGTDAWAERATIAATSTLRFLLVFSGAIYAARDESNQLLKWNGVNAWLSMAASAAGVYPRGLFEYNNRIFAGMDGAAASLSAWNGINAWVSQDSQPGGSTIRRLVVYQDRIHAAAEISGPSPTYNFYRWNGTETAINTISDVLEDIIEEVVGAPAGTLSAAALAELKSAMPEEVSVYIDSDMTLREFIERAEIGQRWRLIPDLARTLSPQWFDPAAPVDPLHLRDDDFVAGTFRMYHDVDAIRHIVRFRYDPPPDGMGAPIVEAESTFSKFFYRATEQMDVESWIKNEAHAQAIADDYSTIMSAPLTMAIFEVAHHGFDHLPMDRLKITRARAMSATGALDGVVFRIFRIAKRPATKTVEITAVLDSEISI